MNFHSLYSMIKVRKDIANTIHEIVCVTAKISVLRKLMLKNELFNAVQVDS